jgi:hypothetical protein
MIVQPNWKDEVYLENGADTGPIEVSSFIYFHTGNENNKDSFVRELLNEVLDLGNDLNSGLFAQENAASDKGRVRQLIL